MNHPINIAGIGSYLPPGIRRNHEITPDEEERAWLLKSGFRERRVAAPDQTIIDLACHAAVRALSSAGISASEVDRLFLVSSTFQPGALVPSGVVKLQQKIGADRCVSHFLAETCCGALMALELAAGLIASGMARNVLVVAAETFSRTRSPTPGPTRRIGLSMGDGAGAVLLSGSGDWDNGRLGSCFQSNADFQSGLVLKPEQQQIDGETTVGLFFGLGPLPPSYCGRFLRPDEVLEELRRFTLRTVPAGIAGALSKAGLRAEDIDYYLLHQPNRHFLDAWRRAANIPDNRTLDTLERFGNVSSPSVLINLDLAYQAGHLQPGHAVLLAAVGEGATWGASIWRWRIDVPQRPTYLLREPELPLQSQLATIENHSMLELWEKFILPNAKNSYRHEELFEDFIPTMAVFEGVPIEAAFAFLSRTENMAQWTMSMRNLRLHRDDIYVGDEAATPTGKVYIRTLCDRSSGSIEWRCSHDDPEDLWLVYRGLLVDAQVAFGRPGTAFFWVNFTHERAKKDPMLAMGFRVMYGAHKVEMNNLKRILESQAAG